jgi:hypothetical protein
MQRDSGNWSLLSTTDLYDKLPGNKFLCLLETGDHRYVTDHNYYMHHFS